MRNLYKEYRKFREYKLFKRMYLELFNSVTDALELMETDPKMAELKLMLAQYVCEEMFLDADPKTRKERKKQRNERRYMLGIHF